MWDFGEYVQADDLAANGMTGEQFHDTVEVQLEPLVLGGQEYLPVPDRVPAELTITKATTGNVYELSFRARLHGPCFRCLTDTTLDETIDARRVPRIEPGGFYIDNLPGDMETAAMFRPEVKHIAGLVTRFDFGTNEFTADPKSNLAFFLGKEPNLNWTAFADCIFEVCPQAQRQADHLHRQLRWHRSRTPASRGCLAACRKAHCCRCWNSMPSAPAIMKARAASPATWSIALPGRNWK